MNDKLAVIDAYEQWWKTRPEPHISAPREIYIQQDKIIAIWLCAWEAAIKHKEDYEKAQTR